MKWTSPEVNRLFGSWTQQGEREREREEGGGEGRGKEMGEWRKGRTKGEIHKADSRKRDGGRGVEKKKGEERKRGTGRGTGSG